MTAQISNRFVFNGIVYSIIAQEYPLDYSPSIHGIVPCQECTACWRGYYCKFVVDKDQLFLRNLDVFIIDDQEPIIINDIAPIVMGGVWEYLNLYIPIKYTGSVLIGTDFINEYYIHMGYQQFFAYKTVYELTFHEGRLNKFEDFSKEVEKFRQMNPDVHAQTKDDILNQISRLFSLDYKNKWFLNSR